MNKSERQLMWDEIEGVYKYIWLCRNIGDLVWESEPDQLEMIRDVKKIINAHYDELYQLAVRLGLDEYPND